MMYDSYIPPIQAYYAAKEKELEAAVMRAVESVDIHVDREELLKALQYDRGQYQKGYDAGFADGFCETLHVVRCMDCVYRQGDENPMCMVHTEPYSNARGYKGEAVCVEMTDFCSFGKRKEAPHEA